MIPQPELERRWGVVKEKIFVFHVILYFSQLLQVIIFIK